MGFNFSKDKRQSPAKVTPQNNIFANVSEVSDYKAEASDSRNKDGKRRRRSRSSSPKRKTKKKSRSPKRK